MAAQPNAKATAVVGVHGDVLKIRVASPPVDGAANEALLRFLAASLWVKQACINLVSGATGRRKVFEISGVDFAAAVAALTPK